LHRLQGFLCLQSAGFGPEFSKGYHTPFTSTHTTPGLGNPSFARSTMRGGCRALRCNCGRADSADFFSFCFFLFLLLHEFLPGPLFHLSLSCCDFCIHLLMSTCLQEGVQCIHTMRTSSNATLHAVLVCKILLTACHWARAQRVHHFDVPCGVLCHLLR